MSSDAVSQFSMLNIISHKYSGILCEDVSDKRMSKGLQKERKKAFKTEKQRNGFF